MSRNTAFDVIDLETGELLGSHILRADLAEKWARVLYSLGETGATVVEHFISPMTCPRCASIVRDYSTKVG